MNTPGTHPHAPEVRSITMAHFTAQLKKLSQALARWVNRALPHRPLPPLAPAPRSLPANRRASAAIMPIAAHLLTHARTQWQFGDWQSLAKLAEDQHHLAHHPQRAELRILATAGALQTQAQPDITAAKARLKQALDEGASREALARMLIAGVHNNLAKGSALAGRPQAKVLGHFEQAQRIGLPGVPAELTTLPSAARQLGDLKKTVRLEQIALTEWPELSQNSGAVTNSDAVLNSDEVLNSGAVLYSGALVNSEADGQISALGQPQPQPASIPSPVQPQPASIPIPEDSAEPLPRIGRPGLRREADQATSTNTLRGAMSPPNPAKPDNTANPANPANTANPDNPDSDDANLDDFIADIAPLFRERSITYVDVGAAVGKAFTKFLETTQIKLWEAHLIESNLQRYRELQNVVGTCPLQACYTYPMGISDHPKTARFNAIAFMTPEAPTDRFSEHASGLEAPESQRLDEIAEHFTHGRAHVLKLDVEGDELEVLKSAKRVLKEQRIDVLYVKVGLERLGTRQTYLGDLDALLRSYGYRLFKLYEPKNEWNGDSPLLRLGHAAYMSHRFKATHPHAKTIKP